MSYEYRIRWRRSTWKAGSVSVRYYQHQPLAEAFAAKLRESGEFEFVTFDRRKVGRWRDAMEPDRRSAPSMEPIEDVRARFLKGLVRYETPDSPSLSEVDPPESPMGGGTEGVADSVW